jgi:hypothetical protein
MRRAGIEELAVLEGRITEGLFGALPGSSDPLRAHLDAELVENSVKHFPDQHQWLARLRDQFGWSTIRAVMQGVGYDRQPELLTCHLCLFTSRSLAKVAEPGFDASGAISMLAAVMCKTGAAPSPERLLAMMDCEHGVREAAGK